MEHDMDKQIGSLSAIMRMFPCTVMLKKGTEPESKAVDLSVNLQSNITRGHEL